MGPAFEGHASDRIEKDGTVHYRAIRVVGTKDASLTIPVDNAVLHREPLCAYALNPDKTVIVNRALFQLELALQEEAVVSAMMDVAGPELQDRPGFAVSTRLGNVERFRI